MHPDVKTISVLYIEDDEDHARLVSKMLKKVDRVNFIVDVKGDLDSGISYLNSIDCNIDVILLDLMLPNSDGVNTFKEIYNICKVPIVIMSGHEDIAYSCISLGAQDYLVKPDISPALIGRSLEYAIERYATKQRIETEQKRFRLLSDANFEGVTITRDGIMIDVNNQFCKIIGYDKSELIGMHVRGFVAPKDINMVLHNIKIQKEEPYEHMALKKDGTEFPVEIHGRTLADGVRLTAIRDMTRYKKADDDLRRSRTQYKDLVEATNASIYEIDFRTMKFIYVNDVMCKFTGWSKEELLAKGPFEFLTEKGIREFSNRLERLKKGEYILDTHEYQVKVKDGSLLWTLITAKFKSDESGNITGANVVAIDITPRKIAETEAKIKEEIIFGELETKIFEWREEIAEHSILQQHTIKKVSKEMECLTNGAEGT